MEMLYQKKRRFFENEAYSVYTKIEKKPIGGLSTLHSAVFHHQYSRLPFPKFGLKIQSCQMLMLLGR
jgi:hypothetical protein